jgi:hypothetical protein
LCRFSGFGFLIKTMPAAEISLAAFSYGTAVQLASVLRQFKSGQNVETSGPEILL